MPDPFLVLATQNPIESEGTYPLPEAQIDRFMLKILVDYPEHDEELTVVHRQLVAQPELEQALSLEDLLALQRAVAGRVRRSRPDQLCRRARHRDPRPGDVGLPELADYIAFGASPRGPIAVTQGHARSRCSAAATTPSSSDVQELIKDAFRHRLVLTYQALAEERSSDSLLDEIIAAVPVPQLDLGRERVA